MRKLARWTAGLMVLAWGLVLAAWLALQFWILPHIDDWRPRIERQASSALGLKLSIGQIRVRSGGWIPALELHDLRFTDRREREVLRLPLVSAALSARSLLAFELRFEQLLIDGPQLEVRRDKLGRVFVAGLSLDEAEPQSNEGAELADWFFSQHEFAVVKGVLRWTDESRDAPPLKLSDVNLVIRNGLRHHDLRLDATPPPQWGQRLSLRGRFTQPLLGRPGDMRQWSGQLHADLPRADVRELRRHVTLPFELSEGDGALRAWIDLKHGEAVGATMDLALRAVTLRLAPKIEPLDLEKIEGRLTLQRSDKGLNLSATQLGFTTGDGLVWPRSDLSLKLQQTLSAAGELGPVEGGTLDAQRLDLAVMAQIGTRLPLGTALHQLLTELKPEGIVSELSAQWSGPLDKPRSYQVKSHLTQLSLASQAAPEPTVAGRPGFRQAELHFSANERGGQGKLSIQSGNLELPGVFEKPLIAVDKLGAGLQWRIDTPADGGLPQLELKLSDLKFANADASGEFNARWATGPGKGTGRGGRFPGTLDLNGRIDRAQAASVARYLPLHIGPDTRHWVRDALLGGEARDAQVKLQGDLWDFPFDRSPKGQFRIALKAQDVQLNYVPSTPAQAGQPAFESTWPVMERVNAELVFDRNSMEIRKGRGRVFGVELSGVKGGIKDLSHDSTLVLEGLGRGPLNDMLRYARVSPVSELTGQALTPATGTGQAELSLNLSIPLLDSDKTTLKGSVLLLGNELRLRPDLPVMAQARGRVHFSHKGLNLQGVSTRALGGEASIEGGSLPDGSLRFTAQGVASADGLRRATELPAIARLAQLASGQSSYRMELGISRGLTELSINSSLQGMALDLPAPLRKDAETALPLRYQTQLSPETRAGTAKDAPRDTLRLALGNGVQATYQRDIAGAQARVLRGALALQDSLPALPASGVHARVQVGTVDLDAWSKLSQQVLGTAAGEALEGGYAPTQLSLKAQDLLIGGRHLTRLNAELQRVTQGPEVGTWRASLDADQIKGDVAYRDARSSGGNTPRVHARLARLSLPKSEAEKVESFLDQQPSQVPALDIMVEDFELRGLKLGRLEVEAQYIGVAREWRMNRLQLAQPDASLSATGSWVAEPGQTRRRAQMDFKLKVNDGGNFLERLGMGRAVRGGKGEVAGQVNWVGSPLSPDYPSMTGQLSVNLDAGQFLKADPGMGRLLGVLSLQSLPRRLTLDFRDLFQEGFAFDSFSGDVKIVKGSASTNNLRMRGVAAVVLMEGQTDLARETQDLRVIVVPEISATTASLAYAAINPAVGLGTLFAQLLLRKPMMSAGTREFHVTGSWSDPKVDKVERKTEEAESPASAASAASAP